MNKQKLCQLRKGKCEDCGTDVARWDDYSKIFRPKYMAEHHHIIPLIDYQHDPLDPYAAWREGNLALLCHACHQERHRVLRAEKRPPEPQLRLAL